MKDLDIQLQVKRILLEERVSLEEGKMKTIATMFSQGKRSAERK